jgi:glycine cleavage system regulatory protein
MIGRLCSSLQVLDRNKRLEVSVKESSGHNGIAVAHTVTASVNGSKQADLRRLMFCGAHVRLS